MSSLIDEYRATEFRYYPTHYMFGVIDSRASAEEALNALLSAGFSRDGLLTWYEEEGATLIDPSGEAHGPLARIWRFMQKSTEERKLIDDYTSAVRQGHIVVGVRVPDSHDKDRVHHLLKSHGAHLTIHLGSATFERLEA